MKVRVYRNLHKNKLSVQTKTENGWRVRHHVDLIGLINARFVVSQAGRARVLRDKRKNVHAYIEGELIRWNGFDSTKLPMPSQINLESVVYNPYKMANFQIEKTGEEILFAPRVMIDRGKIYVSLE